MRRFLVRGAFVALLLVGSAACSRTSPDVVGSPFEVVDHQLLGLNSNGGDVDYFLVRLPGVEAAREVIARYERWLRARNADVECCSTYLPPWAVNYGPADEFVQEAGFQERHIAEAFLDAAGGGLDHLIVVSAE